MNPKSSNDDINRPQILVPRLDEDPHSYGSTTNAASMQHGIPPRFRR